MVQNVYYYSFHHSTFQYNTYQYGNQILAYDVPASLPTDYSYSSGYTSATIFGGNGFPTVSRTPYITITNNNFGTFFGFTAGDYPAGGTTGGKSFGTSINYAPAVNRNIFKFYYNIHRPKFKVIGVVRYEYINNILNYIRTSQTYKIKIIYIENI